MVADMMDMEIVMRSFCYGDLNVLDIFLNAIRNTIYFFSDQFLYLIFQVEQPSYNKKQQYSTEHTVLLQQII